MTEIVGYLRNPVRWTVHESNLPGLEGREQDPDLWKGNHKVTRVPVLRGAFRFVGHSRSPRGVDTFHVETQCGKFKLAMNAPALGRFLVAVGQGRCAVLDDGCFFPGVYTFEKQGDTVSVRLLHAGEECGGVG